MTRPLRLEFAGALYHVTKSKAQERPARRRHAHQDVPLESMRRLAALVPRPRLHLIRFHGVLAPNAGLRAAIGPGTPEKPGDDAARHAHEASARMGWARLLKRVFAIDLEHCPQCGGELKIIAAPSTGSGQA